MHQHTEGENGPRRDARKAALEPKHQLSIHSLSYATTGVVSLGWRPTCLHVAGEVVRKKGAPLGAQGPGERGVSPRLRAIAASTVRSR